MRRNWTKNLVIKIQNIFSISRSRNRFFSFFFSDRKNCDFWEYSILIDSSITKNVRFVLFVISSRVVLELLRRANIAGASSIRSSRIQVSIDG